MMLMSKIKKFALGGFIAFVVALGVILTVIVILGVIMVFGVGFEEEEFENFVPQDITQAPPPGTPTLINGEQLQKGPPPESRIPSSDPLVSTTDVTECMKQIYGPDVIEKMQKGEFTPPPDIVRKVFTCMQAGFVESS